MSGTFWRFYAVLTAIVLLSFIGLSVGPFVEEIFFPIRADQAIRVIERTDARLCYAWTFVKLRERISDNEDSFLDVDGVPSGVVAPYDMETGYPWGVARFAVPPRATAYTLRHCIALPPIVKPTDTVRIRQTAFYPGWGGLWRLSVPFPDVVSEGAPGL